MMRISLFAIWCGRRRGNGSCSGKGVRGRRFEVFLLLLFLYIEEEGAKRRRHFLFSLSALNCIPFAASSLDE